MSLYHRKPDCIVKARTKDGRREGRIGEYCPHCGNREIYTFKDGKRYRCAGCKKDFTIKTGTLFGESKLPIRKWFIAIYLLSHTSKGMSSVQLAKHVGVTQKTAWFMAHRIRSAKKHLPKR